MQGQAIMLDELLSETGERVTLCMALEAPDAVRVEMAGHRLQLSQVLVERIEGRWVHTASGRTYHAQFAPPESLGEGERPTEANMLDDVTGEPLTRQKDDTAARLKVRLEVYRCLTQPIMQHYESAGIVENVNGDQEPAKVWADMSQVFTGFQV